MFFADLQRMGTTLGLTEKETETLSRLSTRQVNYFARSLKRKRLGEVKKFLTRSYSVLGERFDRLFFRYADTYVPQGIKKHRDDALMFAEFLEDASCLEATDPPWALDVVRYEAGWVKAWDPRYQWVIRRIRYSISVLARSAMLGEKDREPPMQPTIALWFRIPRRGRPDHCAISLPRVLSRLLIRTSKK